MFRKKLIKWSPVILCLLLFIGFLRYVIPVVVKGDSMVPNLMENQRLFVLKNRQLDRFDIIVFREEDEKQDNHKPFWAFIGKEEGTAESGKKELSHILNHNLIINRLIIKNLLYLLFLYSASIAALFLWQILSTHLP